MTSFAFDAYGTLFDVSSAVAGFRTELGADHDDLALMWRTKQLEYTWTLTLMNRYEDFWTVTKHALEYSLARFAGVDPLLADALMEAYRSLRAYPDVSPALVALKESGSETAVFTNATSKMVTEAISSAGIGHLLDRVVSLDDIGKYKTTPESYEYLCASLGKPATEITLVSANRWDVAGGTAFGLATVWVNRPGMPDEYQNLAPLQTITSLSAL